MVRLSAMLAVRTSAPYTMATKWGSGSEHGVAYGAWCVAQGGTRREARAVAYGAGGRAGQGGKERGHPGCVHGQPHTIAGHAAGVAAPWLQSVVARPLPPGISATHVHEEEEPGGALQLKHLRNVGGRVKGVLLVGWTREGGWVAGLEPAAAVWHFS